MALFSNNPFIQTAIVVAVLLVAAVASMRVRREGKLFPPSVTVELKGLAILMVIFGHIGYFLVSDNRFLVPLSNYSGVGVDLFLVLSGYGLVASALKKPLTRWQFYRKRFFKVFIPVAVTILLLLLTDYFFVHRSFPLILNIKNLLGFFPTADLYKDIDSPLWFITPLLAYYIIFPLIFSRRFPFLSALVLLVLARWFALQDISGLLSATPGVANLYQLHLLSFPVGMAVAALANKPPWLIQQIGKLRQFLDSRVWRWFFGILALLILTYTLQYTAVGQGWVKEWSVSICSSLALVLLFVAKKIEFKFFSFIGAISFELYMIHWPLLYQYDPLYKLWPVGFATALSLGILIGLSWLYQRFLHIITKPLS